MNSDLAARFDALGPWVTRFVVDGEVLGGEYDAEHDDRVAQFRSAFPNAATILELGSFEGGHTARLARLDGVTSVLGLEGRPENIARAQLALEVLGVSNAEVMRADLERLELTALGSFDAVFNCGLMYHLTRPWALLERVAAVTDAMFLSTHYCADTSANATENGYAGYWYQEFGYDDCLSGLSPASFWPTRESLFAMLAAAGFGEITVTHEEPAHPNGPIIGLTTRK